MKYGRSIKSARAKLNIFQKDISNENLSKNLLSNIEKDKTNLTPQKGLMIYKRLLEHAVLKKIHIDIEFDELLNNNKEYFSIKKTYKICWDLINIINLNAHIDIDRARNLLDYLKFNRHDILTYHGLYYISKALDERHKIEKVDVLCKALDYIKVMDMSVNMFIYRKHLYESVNLLYEERKFDKLIDYFDDLRAAQKCYSNKVEPSIYYNLALFHSKLGNFDVALKYYDLYEKQCEDISLIDRLDLLNNKAVILSETKKLNEAIDLYIIGAKESRNANLLIQESLFLSNIVYYVATNDLLYLKELFNTSFIRLKEIYPEILKSNAGRSSLILNLAVGYYYKGDSLSAEKYFEQAYTLATNDSRKIIVLSDAFDYYRLCNKLPVIKLRLNSIDQDLLSRKELEVYYQLLLKISENT